MLGTGILGLANMARRKFFHVRSDQATCPSGSCWIRSAQSFPAGCPLPVVIKLRKLSLT